MNSLKLKDHDSQLNSDPVRTRATSIRLQCRSQRVEVEWYRMLGVIRSHPDRLPTRTTTSANADFRIRAVARETRSNQAGPQQTPFRTCALAGKYRGCQRDALAAPRTQWIRWVATRPSGMRWILRCVTRVMALARITDFSTDPLLPLNTPCHPPPPPSLSLFSLLTRAE